MRPKPLSVSDSIFSKSLFREVSLDNYMLSMLEKYTIYQKVICTPMKTLTLLCKIECHCDFDNIANFVPTLSTGFNIYEKQLER